MDDYDTINGIKKYLADGLKGLNDLVSDRHEASYKRGQKLHDFCILGRWFTDAYGNFTKIISIDSSHEEKSIADVAPDIPDVIESDKARVYLARHISQQVQITSEYVAGIPKDGLICPLCTKPWDIASAHETVEIPGTKILPVPSDLIGSKLKDIVNPMIQKLFGPSTIARLDKESPVCSDKWIDNNIRPGYKTIQVNKRGWISESPEARKNYDDYVTQSGDKVYFNTWQFWHKACEIIKCREEEKDYFESLLVKAGFHSPMLELPNGYDGDERHPWFQVQTLIGPIIIGWRKRVIHIDWSKTGKDFSSLFTKEDVTQWPGGIHAWGKEKATEYLRKIRLNG